MLRFAATAAGIAAIVLAGLAPAAQGAPPQTVDGAGFVGLFTSLALDPAGNPVISYHDGLNGDLKLVHCDDAACAGGDESPQTVDSAGDVGQYTSLELDLAGNPVISYWDGSDFEPSSNFDLKLVHCNDPACADGDESPQTVDSAGDVGQYTSLELDASGNPVISYSDATNRDLKLVRCNDPACAGGDEVPQSPDSEGFVGLYTSLQLDAAGDPAISYFDFDSSNRDLKVVHATTRRAQAATRARSARTVPATSASSTRWRLTPWAIR